ncbi:MAG: MBL fold metallo-hydrolase [Oscillospiraceae bacterium]|jgi:phosphoribosyl 1,2-cyclic phosphodiesterase|nr:MBL fold metallo-hydrolase [Oscillospiraceae bacterium]
MFLCTLASGSSGNCAVVSNGETHLLVDAGISARRIQAGLTRLNLRREQLAGVLITHEHTDHISGLSVFLKKNEIPVYASKETAQALLCLLPMLRERIHTFRLGTSFAVDGLEVTPFPTWHDTPGSVGYRITNGKARIAVATDLGCVTRQVADAIEGVDLLLLEANYDRDMLRSGSYPAFLKRRIESDYGHLSNEDAGRAAAWAMQNGTKTILLGHLSKENNQAQRALETVGGACAGGIGTVRLEVAPRSEPGLIYFAGESNVEYTDFMCGQTERDVLYTGG